VASSTAINTEFVAVGTTVASVVQSFVIDIKAATFQDNQVTKLIVEESRVLRQLVANSHR
jgi:hypothetical protein